MTVVKHHSTVSETPCFPGENLQESSTITNYYGDSKLLRHSIFLYGRVLWGGGWVGGAAGGRAEACQRWGEGGGGLI